MGDQLTMRPDAPSHTFESTPLYNETYKFVREYMSRYDMSHDMTHIDRVLGLSRHIYNTETRTHPEAPLDGEAILLAALLHDVGDHKYSKPGEDAEQTISTLLQANGASPTLRAKVSHITAHVSYSKEAKDPAATRAALNAHPELGVVQDADRLDATGAVGVGRAFTYGAAKAQGRGMEGVSEHFVEKLEKLEGLMKTETGRGLARERTERLSVFRGWWEEETGFGML